jgi:hypothetical protein
LNRVLDRKTELYKDCGKDEDEDDFDAENYTESAQRNNEHEVSEETERRNERIGREIVFIYIHILLYKYMGICLCFYSCYH